jgi:uncharacterized membrane protein YgcG
MLPVRHVPHILSGWGGQATAGVRVRAGLALPREIWRLTGALYERLALGGRDQRLFVAYGDPKEVEEIRECIDTGVAFGAHLQSRSLAEALLQLLCSLPVPVIPSRVHQMCVAHVHEPGKVWAALEELPAWHMPVLVYLISFLRELLLHKPLDLTPESLALVWGYVLMQPDLDIDHVRVEELENDQVSEAAQATATAGGGGGGGTGGTAAGGGWKGGAVSGGGGAQSNGGRSKDGGRDRETGPVYLTKEQAVVMLLIAGKNGL